jgi:quercetin dioxygenase-like cupin family protein
MSSTITSNIHVARRTQSATSTNAVSGERHYPRTIDNGAGELLTFLGVHTSPDGREVLEVENQVQPGAGPPMHAHHLQEESLTVEEGCIGYRLAGGPDCFAGPGDTVTFAPGQMHRFWNAGDGVLRCSGRVSPPDNMEYVLTQVNSHRCSAAAAARTRSTRRTCSGATGRRSRKATSRHRSALWCSRSCERWVDS